MSSPSARLRRCPWSSCRGRHRRSSSDTPTLNRKEWKSFSGEKVHKMQMRLYRSPAVHFWKQKDQKCLFKRTRWHSGGDLWSGTVTFIQKEAAEMPSSSIFIKKKSNSICKCWSKCVYTCAHIIHHNKMSWWFSSNNKEKWGKTVVSLVHSCTNWFTRWEQHPSFCSRNVVVFIFCYKRLLSSFSEPMKKTPLLAQCGQKEKQHGTKSLTGSICIQQWIRSSKCDSAQRNTQRH